MKSKCMTELQAFILFLISLKPCQVWTKDSKTLYIGGFFPMTRSFSAWGQGCPPAAELAVEHINQRQDIIPGYTLMLKTMDTQGSPGVATRELFDLIQEESRSIMLLGPFPSHIAQAVAQTARWWNLVQVSPAAFTPELSDRDVYPYFFRTRAAITSFNPARISFINYFKWKRVAIITWQINYFLETVDILSKNLKENNISVVASEVYQEGDYPVEELTRIRDRNARIVIVFAYEERARRIFCQAYKMGMTGPRYVWIMHYGNDPRWMNKATSDEACSASEVREAANNHFITSDITLREDGIMPLAGLNTTQFLDLYRKRAEASDVEPADFYAPLTYDAVWSIGLALNASREPLQELGLILEDFSYSNAEMTSIFMEKMGELSFEGMMGPISFTGTGDIGTLKTRLTQYTDGIFHVLGYHDAQTEHLEWRNPQTPVVWQDGKIPYDDIQIRLVKVSVNLGLFYVMLGLSVCGLLLASIFLTFNIIYRNKKIIRMSSPNLNNLVVVGGMFSYLSIVFYGLSVLVDNQALLPVCHIEMILISVGYSLGFGSLFAKTWRVFKIFTSKSAKRVMISDMQLFGLVFVFVLADLIYFTIWFTVDNLYIFQNEGPPEVSSSDPDVYYQYWVERCTSNYIAIWQIALYGLKGVILIFGVFLAWQTKDVTIKALNDSKYIGFAVYNVTTSCLIGAPASFILDDTNVDAKFGITACCIFLSTTATLCIVFLPKILNINNEIHTHNSALGAHNQSNSTQEAPNSITDGSICAVCKAKLKSDGAVLAGAASTSHNT